MTYGWRSTALSLGQQCALGEPSAGIVAIAGGLLWFVLGSILCALSFGAAAAVVSRQEDLSSVIMPIKMVVLGSHLVFFWVVATPPIPSESFSRCCLPLHRC